MKKIDFGTIICALRDKGGYSQKDLARKLGYSEASVSRMETGKLVPPFIVMERALQLLGKDSQGFITFFLDTGEQFGYQTMKELTVLYVEGKYAEVRRRIAEVEGKRPFTSGLFRQFILFCKAATEKDISDAERLERLTEALHITVKDFRIDRIATELLSYNEILIISKIADAYFRMGDNENAAQILYGVRESMDRFYSEKDEKARTFPALLYNLSVYVAKLGRDSEAYTLCKEAREWAVTYNKTWTLPSILAAIAHYQHDEGNRRDSKENYAKAYFTAKAMEQHKLANLIVTVAKDEVGIDLETLFIQSP